MKAFRIFLFVLLPSALFAANDPVKDLEKRVTEHTLKNGMKLLILERHFSPLVSFQMMFHAGGVDEVNGKTGLAHLFEHMMFKGTKTVGTKDYAREKIVLDKIDETARAVMAEEAKGAKADPNKLKALKSQMASLELEHQKWIVPSEFDQLYQQAGGEGLNAYTAKDVTAFIVSLPSNKWELWAMLESDRMKHPVLREFYKEKDVVMEERRMRYDNDPEGKLWENFLSIAYQAHPYGLPTIGWMPDIRGLTLSDAEKFFKAHYAPNNAVVAIVGDVSAEEVIGKCEQYFAGVSSQTLPESAITEEPEQEGERRAVVNFDAEPQILIGYHKPNAPDPDDFVFDLIDQILSRGRTSMFHKNIEEKKIAVSAWASNGNPGERFPNMMIFGGSPRNPSTNEDLENAVLAQLESLKNVPVPARDLEKIRNQMEADFIRNLASNAGMASQLCQYQSILGDWKFMMQYLEGIKKVTPEDIQRVAKKYFTPRNRTVVRLERDHEKK